LKLKSSDETSRPDRFTGDIHQILKKEKYQLYNFSKKLKTRKNFPSSFYEVSITCYSQSDKNITKKKATVQYCR
jgi:hypothetical protein